jgi:pimeloyl-ACP methyl ester carboxylesterase
MNLFDLVKSSRRVKPSGSLVRSPKMRLGMAVLLGASLLLGAFKALPLSASTGLTPIIIIPGIAGSTFQTTNAYNFYTPDNGHGGSYSHGYGANETVWVNALEAAFSGSDDYFDILRLKADADTPLVDYSALPVSGIYTDAYKDLTDFLHRRGYVDNVTLFTFAYDWRRDIPTATYARLDALVNLAKVSAGAGQVDLLGHSMGGLVARNYISTDPAAAQKVRRLVTFGTPYLGSPKFLKTLLYGDQFGPNFLGIGLNPDEVRDLVQNMAGGWELLPSQAYYNFYNNSSGGLLAPYREDRDVDGNGIASGVMNYNLLSGFLRNLGKNQTANAFAERFHNRLDLNGFGGGPRISFINGSGLATLGQIRDYTGSCWSWFSYKPCPKTDLYNIDGDGTVPYFSASPIDPARGLNLIGEASLHIVNREHGALVQYDNSLGIKTGDGPSLTLLGQILDNTVDPITVAANNKTFAGNFSSKLNQTNSASRTKLGITGFAVSVTDGAEIEAIDAKGQRTGRSAGSNPQKYDRNIEGSNIERVDGTQLVFLPEGGRYTLRLTAASTGSFDLKIRMLQGDAVKQTAVYLNVQVEANNQLELALDGLKGSAPKLRFNNGNSKDKTIAATALLNEQASADREPPKITLNAPAQQKNGTVKINWQATDTLAGLALEQGLIDPTSVNSQIVKNGQSLRLTPGEHTLQVLALDKAGNAGIKEVKFKVA